MDKGRLEPRLTADGSFSLWSETFNQTFHSGRGALEEAHSTFLAPAGLDRFSSGSGIAVMEVCVGTGTNLAALLDVCAQHQLELKWWGLESDRRPLGLALADAGFREVICPIEHPLFPQRDHVVRVAAVCGRDAGRATVVYGTIVQPTDQKRLGAHESKSHHLRRS